ncbi:MAG TPA: AAA family ATPase [Solirubrobacteraceae bacterium]
MGIDVSQALPLLERDSELADLARDVDAVRSGMGRLVVVEGPAGIGKTGLLAAAGSLAEEAGLPVARARGTELEAGFAFGVVRQLFEPLLRDRSRQRSRLLRGAAGLAAEVLGPSVGGSPRGTVRLPEAVHGLYWLTLNLAERGPFLASIDDAHWADPSSLRFLSYLAGRLEGVGVLVIVAARRAEAPAADDLLEVVMRERVTNVVQLRPLTVGATAALLVREYQEEVAPEFASACHDATRGNPFYLRELIHALRADGIDPIAAEVSRVAGQGPASVARSVLTRIAGLSPAAVSVARALAVLGGEGTRRVLSVVGGLDQDSVSAAVDGLTAAEVVVGADPVSFAHPIVRASIYADIPAGERARLQLHVARVFASSGAPAERVAAHLLAARPAGDRWVIDVLSEAAGDALSRGAPDSAVAYLNRALAEAPAGDDRHRVLALLGRAECLAYQSGASAHLIEAMDTASTADERGELALQAAQAMIMRDPDRSEAAIELLDRAIGELPEPDSQLSMRLEAQLLAGAGLKLSTRRVHAERMNGVYPKRLGDEPADRLLLANLANWTLLEGRPPGQFAELARHAGAAGTPAEVACRVAERALGGGRLLREEGPDSQLFYLASWTVWMADRFDRCEHWLDEALEDARERGSVLGYGIASASLAEVAYRRGDLTLAEAHARAAADTSPEDAVAILVAILLEQGRLDEADQILAPYRIASNADHLLLQPIRAARARLRIAQGRAQEAMTELHACGTWLDAWPVKNPSFVPWRSSAAVALNYAGEHERARQMAAEEVALAEPLDLPRAYGIALRTLGVVEQTTDRIDLLEAAIAQLERSEARLEHARALIDYGAALRRTGHRADARPPLRQGLDLAHHCRAPVLAERAREELLATGARPRRSAFTGRDALTSTEARVANMAAQGHSTPEIAQALFVTPKTVETHLAHTYQKLNIHARTELAHALSRQHDP